MHELELALGDTILIGSFLGFWMTRFYLCFFFPLFCIGGFVCCVMNHWLVRNDKSRIPEATRHMIDGFGGWPGSLLAQFVFRSEKESVFYRVRFWSAVFFHLICCYVVYRTFYG